MLSIPEIVDILEKNPSPNKGSLSKAVVHERRVRLHSATTVNQKDSSSALTDLLKDVEKLLPADKFHSFKTLLRYPLPTVDLTDRIYTALEKVFDGRNPVFNYEFSSEDDASDWETYRTQELKHTDLWKNEGFEHMKSAINSVMIVDLDIEQNASRPSPYMYFLGINSVIDLEFVKGQRDKFDWIIFKQPNKKVAVFCDKYYRVFKLKEGTNQIQHKPIVEFEHNLSYCPARFFWTTAVNIKEPVVKKSPISNWLGRLDMLFFYDVSNEHLNLYGRYPIYSVFASSCDFENKETGAYCNNGHLMTRESEYLMSGGKLVACQACERKRLDGAGSVIEIEPPSMNNDQTDLRNPVQLTEAPVASLEYNNLDLQRRKDEIYSGVTGYHGLSINNKAVNEKQVIAIFESLEAALRNPQQNFEKAIQWVDQTICILRYGNTLKSASISLGTEHYILTPSQVMILYKEVKESSSTLTTLDFLEDRYFETEFKNNPEEILRNRILSSIDQFRHLTYIEVSEMYKNQSITFEDYFVKVNFSSLINRFERENLSVVEFGQNVEFENKIKTIQDSLKVYASEFKPELINDDNQTLEKRLINYALGVRSGGVTPQTEDEVYFRQQLQISEMSPEAIEAWEKDKGIRRPVTLKSQAALEEESSAATE